VLIHKLRREYSYTKYKRAPNMHSWRRRGGQGDARARVEGGGGEGGAAGQGAGGTSVDAGGEENKDTSLMDAGGDGGGGDDAWGVELADVEEGEGQEGGASGASGQEAGGASVEAGGEEGCKRAPNMHSWLYSKEGQGRACLAKLQKGP